MVVRKRDKVYRYQVIDDSNRYCPGHAVWVDSNLLQHSSPHSYVRKFANTGQYISTTDRFCPIFLFQKIEPSGYDRQFIALIELMILLIHPSSVVKFRLKDFYPVSPKMLYYFQFGFGLRVGSLGLSFDPDGVDNQVNAPF